MKLGKIHTHIETIGSARKKEFNKLETQNMNQSSGKEQLYWILMIEELQMNANKNLRCAHTHTHTKPTNKSDEQFFNVI